MRKPVKRKYVSRVRSEQASGTRARILAAAQKLFGDRSYAATPISTIAQEAGVSPETIYATFGSKRELLAQMIAAAIAGEEEAVPMADRAWVAEMRREPGPDARLRYWISHTCATIERTSAIHAVVRDAVASEPDLAKLRTEQQRFRFDMQSALMQIVAEPGRSRLRVGTASAAETFWILASPEVHHLLRNDLGWSAARYQAWLTDALLTLLLAPNDTARRLDDRGNPS